MAIITINNKNSLQNAAIVLSQGGILIFSTDTVYGIGCLLSEKAIKRLYQIKNRPLSQPTTILITKNLYHKIRSSEKSGIEISSNMRKDFWNGKITIIFPGALFKMKFPEIITKDNKIGIRLPQSVWLEKLIEIVGPIVTSSANKKGEPAPSKFEEIDPDIIEKADLTIKTDEKLSGKPSRVYDLKLKKYLR